MSNLKPICFQNVYHEKVVLVKLWDKNEIKWMINLQQNRTIPAIP